jgi:hypothetical protein
MYNRVSLTREKNNRFSCIESYERKKVITKRMQAFIVTDYYIS